MKFLPGKILFLFFFFFSIIYSLSSTINPVFAAPGDVFNQSLDQKINDEKEAKKKEESGDLQIFSTRVNNAQLGDTFYNLTKLIVPLSETTADSQSTNTQPTALGTLTQIMSTLYAYPPASGIAYVRDVFTNAGLLAKPAYAQGIGFAGLSPLLPLWKTTRNIAYLTITIIMVAIGFMIIFRMKIDPKTVISLQAALPKIVMTLLLITLSYPIVGFLVDLMYLVMAIIIQIVATGIGQGARTAELQTWYMTGGVGNLGWSVFSGGFSSLDDFLSPLRGQWWINPASSGVTGILLLFKFVGRGLGNALFGIFSPDIIIPLIVALGLLFTFIRLTLLLVNSYIQLLIGLIIGPLQLMFEAIPGRSVFAEWILNIIANLSVFPATAIVLIFGEYLTQLNLDTPLWQPPLMGMPYKEHFTAFLGLGIIFLAPTLVAQVKKLFNPKPVLPITAGTAFAPLTGTVQTGMGAASQFYYLQSSLQQLPFFKKPGGH